MALLGTCVLASANPGKLAEMRALLPGWQLSSLAEHRVESPEETGLTFLDNALLKARHASRATGLAAIADDSGIEVDALGGAPGVHSARFAGQGASDQDNLEKLLRSLAGVPPSERTARYRCVIVYLRAAEDSQPLVSEGVWPGVLIDVPRGENGFGYDPIFLVPERGRTAAELPPAEKNAISHRGQALRALRERLELGNTPVRGCSSGDA